MSTVKSEKIRFEGKEFVKRVRFSSRSGLFSITLPRQIQERMNVGEVSSDTMKGVQAEFKKTVDMYKAAQTTERKVIVYKVEVNAWVWRLPDGAPAGSDDDDASVVFQANDISFADGCGLTIFAEVMVERTLRTADGEESLSYEEVDEHTLPKSLGLGNNRIADRFGTTEDVRVIDWTPEREAWFRDVGLRLEDMVVNVCRTLGDTERALQLMDSGRMLMAPEEKEEAPPPKKKKRARRRW